MKFKLRFEEFFKIPTPKNIADFIAIRKEATEEYLIVKNRYDGGEKGEVIDKATFIEILKQSSNPIILSDSYIDLTNIEI